MQFMLANRHDVGYKIQVYIAIWCMTFVLYIFTIYNWINFINKKSISLLFGSDF